MVKMTYDVTPEIRKRAEALGVIVRPSTRKSKKLDAFTKDGQYIASFGATGYMDYHLWLKDKGKDYAEERRRLYHLRHGNDGQKKKDGRYTPWYLAKYILW